MNKKQDNRYDSSREYGRDRRNARGGNDRRYSDRGVERRRDRDSTLFTLLNAPISEILHEIKGKQGFIWPAKMKIPDHKKNEDKYYDYHIDKGINTDECYHLKKLIEKMINAGELNHFVKDLGDKIGLKEDSEKETENSERYRGEVKTISGGSMLDRDNKTARKRYTRHTYYLYQSYNAK